MPNKRAKVFRRKFLLEWILPQTVSGKRFSWQTWKVYYAPAVIICSELIYRRLFVSLLLLLLDGQCVNANRRFAHFYTHQWWRSKLWLAKYFHQLFSLSKCTAAARIIAMCMKWLLDYGANSFVAGRFEFLTFRHGRLKQTKMSDINNAQ